MPVTLRIDSPTHGRVFVGAEADTVPFRGAEVARDAVSVGVEMFYRWYATHESTRDRYSLHDAALTDPSQGIVRPLGVGSHAIVLAATDRPSDRPGDFEMVTDGGVTGGSGGAGECVVHVVRAELLTVLHHAGGVDEPELPPPDAMIAPLTVQPGDAVTVVARAPRMGRALEMGHVDLRYGLWLECSDDALPPHPLGAEFRLADPTDDSAPHREPVAWATAAIPAFDGSRAWTPVLGGGGGGGGVELRETHPYDRLVLRVWHRSAPARLAHRVVELTLERITLGADAEEV